MGLVNWICWGSGILATAQVLANLMQTKRLEFLFVMESKSHGRMEMEEYEVLTVRPPPEPPPWSDRGARVWNSKIKEWICSTRASEGVEAGESMSFYFVFHFRLNLLVFRVIILSYHKGEGYVCWFCLLDRILVGGNQADSAANSLYPLIVSSISFALFEVHYSMSDRDVRGRRAFGIAWIEGDLDLET
ncbi:unnamed protein product [Cuscuta europaea]|uniref:Uncharacterized protein n=1 Tax=Cuscuta europaea TaxID=41803 RepID=A0A9P1EFB4_CUSEU|nr:unnamed protein product [Cuscuta europaea]